MKARAILLATVIQLAGVNGITMRAHWLTTKDSLLVFQGMGVGRWVNKAHQTPLDRAGG